MCEAGDMKKDKAQDLPGNVCSSMGSGITTGQRLWTRLAGDRDHTRESSWVGTEGYVSGQVEKRGNVPEGRNSMTQSSDMRSLPPGL